MTTARPVHPGERSPGPAGAGDRGRRGAAARALARRSPARAPRWHRTPPTGPPTPWPPRPWRPTRTPTTARSRPWSRPRAPPGAPSTSCSRPRRCWRRPGPRTTPSAAPGRGCCCPAHTVAGVQVWCAPSSRAPVRRSSTWPAASPPAAFASPTERLVGRAPGRRYTSLVPAELDLLLDAVQPNGRRARPVGTGGRAGPAGRDAVLGALRSFDAVLVGGAALPAPPARPRGPGRGAGRRQYGMTETCGGCVYEGCPCPGCRCGSTRRPGGPGPGGWSWAAPWSPGATGHPVRPVRRTGRAWSSRPTDAGSARPTAVLEDGLLRLAGRPTTWSSPGG